MRHAERPLQDRQLLGGVERHRHRRPTPARSPTLLHQHGALVVLGLRRRRRRTSTSRCTAMRRHRWRTRTRSSSRRTSSSAARARRACSSCGASCCTNRVPDVPGGGTVAYVNPAEHRYVDDPVAPRGGRHAGDRRVDPRRARVPAQGGRRRRRDPRARGVDFIHRAIASWRDNPNIEILGNHDAERLSIVSFVVRHRGGRYLHHNFVVALLNDLFGIQSRGGCSLRRPVRPPAARHRHRALARVRARDRRAAARASSRAGCASTSTTSSPRRCSSTSSTAVHLVADHGWRLLRRLPLRPGDRPVAPPRRAGRAADCGSPRSSYDPARGDASTAASRRAGEDALPGYLEAARELLRTVPQHLLEPETALPLSRDFRLLRWFELPPDCLVAAD